MLIIGQFALDLVILGVLMLLSRFYLNRKSVAADFQSAMEKSMALIKEMEALGQSFQGILEEKRELTNILIADLDNKLRKAQLIRNEIIKITDKSIGSGVEPEKSGHRMATTRSTIERLLGKGMSKEEVARRLGLPSGELELIIKLDSAHQPHHKGPKEQ